MTSESSEHEVSSHHVIDNNNAGVTNININDDEEEDKNFDMTWICTFCREAECISNRDSPLLLCEGKCNRPFHYPCAGLMALPPDDEKWICNDCIKGKQQCCVCHEYGVDNDDVYCCSKKGCGLFYHESCLLNMYGIEVGEKYECEEEIYDVNNVKGGGYTTAVRKVVKPTFQCPAHSCWTCCSSTETSPQSCIIVSNEPADDKEDVKEEEEETTSPTMTTKSKKGRKQKKKKKKGKQKKDNASKPAGQRLYRCLDCPIAYHFSCIPPTARFHELALLCHEHAYTSKLPDLDLESSLQGKVEAAADEKLNKIFNKNKAEKELQLKRKRSSMDNDESANLFFPGIRGYGITDEENELFSSIQERQLPSSTIQYLSYCLPCELKQEVHSKPPSYRQVCSLRYDQSNRPKRRPPSGETCRCVKSCDEHCLNRMIMMECVGNGSKSNGEKNPYWNCNQGPGCGNRGLGQRKYAKCKPKREQGKGWGLVAINGAKKGELVQEYVGEVIDEATKESRLHSWSKEHPNDSNFYVMALDTGFYIDARNEANLSRFINHSCDPNCRLTRMNVGGHMRVGIYCLRDVMPGEFLSYDYKFDTKHGDKFVCRCGSKNCRGTMKGGKDLLDGSGESERKTKKRVMAEARAKYDADKKFLEDISKTENKRLIQIGMVVPGASTEEGSETVTSGPNHRHRAVARKSRLFLWRNALHGANLAARYYRIQSQKFGKA